LSGRYRRAAGPTTKAAPTEIALVNCPTDGGYFASLTDAFMARRWTRRVAMQPGTRPLKRPAPFVPIRDCMPVVFRPVRRCGLQWTLTFARAALRVTSAIGACRLSCETASTSRPRGDRAAHTTRSLFVLTAFAGSLASRSATAVVQRFGWLSRGMVGSTGRYIPMDSRVGSGIVDQTQMLLPSADIAGKARERNGARVTHIEDVNGRACLMQQI
jgi:hypothetical protein